MGWNTSCVVVKQPLAKVIAALAGSYTPTDEVMYFEDASAWTSLEPNIAVAQIEDWTIAWCPTPTCLFDSAYMDIVKELSRGSTAITLHMQSVVDMYGFRYIVDGEVVRDVMHEANKPSTEIGDPLPEESGIQLPSWGHDEAWCFKILEALTGTRLDMERNFQMLVPGADPNPTPFVEALSTKKPASKAAKKPATKPAAKKPAAKPATKPAAKKPAAKATTKPKKPAAKATTKPAAKKLAAKAAKPVAKKSAAKKSKAVKKGAKK